MQRYLKKSKLKHEILLIFFVILKRKNHLMEINGKLIKILTPLTGQGKNGEWKKQEFVIQTEGPYPKSVCFTVWNNKIDLAQFRENQSVKVSFDPESREFNSKWYTDLIAWRMAEGSVSDSSAIAPEDDTVINNMPDAVPDDTTDDLPF